MIRLDGKPVIASENELLNKEPAVRMRGLGEKGASPLPRTNSRFGHPTPQRGVEVERKRKDRR